MKDSEIADDLLVDRILAGELELFRFLVDRHKNLVFAMIMRQISSRETAEELSHEVFVKAYKNLKSFRKEAKFSSWLVRIALNHCSSYFSSKVFKQKLATDELENLEIEGNNQSPEDALEHKELTFALQTCLQKLKPLFRDVITICALESRSYDEAAQLFEVPVGTIRSRLNKARLLMRECLEKRGAYG